MCNRDKQIQKQFNQAVKTLKKNARKPDKNGNLWFTKEEGKALFKHLCLNLRIMT